MDRVAPSLELSGSLGVVGGPPGRPDRDRAVAVASDRSLQSGRQPIRFANHTSYPAKIGDVLQDSVALSPQISQVQVDRLDALYRLTDRLYRARSLSDVFDAALDAVTVTLGCRRASILLFDAAGTMDFVAWRGLSDNYRRAVRGHSPWTPEHHEAQAIYVVDIDDTDESEAVKAAVRGENIRGLAFIPLMAQGLVVGKFMAYYRVAAHLRRLRARSRHHHRPSGRLRHRAGARRGGAAQIRGRSARERRALPPDVRACAGHDLDERRQRPLSASQPHAA